MALYPVIFDEPSALAQRKSGSLDFSHDWQWMLWGSWHTNTNDNTSAGHENNSSLVLAISDSDSDDRISGGGDDDDDDEDDDDDDDMMISIAIVSRKYDDEFYRAQTSARQWLHRF